MTNIKPLPRLDAVALPEGLSNRAFGQIAFIVQLFECYQKVMERENRYLPSHQELIDILVKPRDEASEANFHKLLYCLLEIITDDVDYGVRAFYSMSRSSRVML